MNPIEAAIDRAKAEIDGMVDDLRACHEYYCRNNCATLVGRTPDTEHTPRCKKLVETWGFQMVPRKIQT